MKLACAALVFFAASWTLAAASDAAGQPLAEPAPAETAQPVRIPVPAEGDTTELRLDAENWRWVPNKLHVPLGTKVVLNIRSYDATHRFDLEKYGLQVVLPQDKTTRVEFVADRAGKFKWRCGRPCGDGCPRMTGTLIVAEPAGGAASD